VSEPVNLLDGPGLQGSLFGSGPLRAAPLGSLVRTIQLDADSQVDHAPGWLAGADELFIDLLGSLSWESHYRWIKDQAVLEPRLSTTFQAPPETLGKIAGELTSHYGRGYIAAWANLYRDADDSVSWHGDRYRPGSLHQDVALVSVGGRRTFRIRRRGGGSSWAWSLASGDLLVMRGPVQQRFEHCVPKLASAGPRISIVFRCPEGREFDQTIRPGPTGLRRHERRL
jgi:alkylated DNA repair dioxygenase AlkB